MNLFEYKTEIKNRKEIEILMGHKDEEDYLNQQGKNGWKLICVVDTPVGFNHPVYYYWEREII